MASSNSSATERISHKRDQPGSHYTRNGKRAKLADKDISQSREKDPSEDPPHRDTQLVPTTTAREADELFDVAYSSDNNNSESDDHSTPFSDTELANIISKSGRRRGLFTGLCRNCEPIVGWFCLDRRSWKRASRSVFTYIQAVTLAKLDDTCSLCSFLGKLTKRLRACGLSDDNRGYHIYATLTNTFFNHDENTDSRYITPAFCLTPSGASFSTRNLMKHNAYFAPDARHEESEGVYARRIKPYTDPALLRQWIQNCDAQHSNIFDCHGPKERESIPYFCVIDCNASPPCLVCLDSRDSKGYTTLSYVWGQDLCEGPDEYGRLPRQLPELIQGAIWVTLALGYQYLWIDRYCVPQDDPIRRRSLVGNMDMVYEDSALCIIAAVAKSPRDGLHGITRPREVTQETFDLGSLSMSQIMTNIKEEVGNSHWNSRGWTYQESLLARRRLVFTETQCCFQCGNQWFLESLDYPKRSNFDFSGIPHPFPKRFDQSEEYRAFEHRAQEYSQRQLSDDSDALPAISGILKRFRFLPHISGVPVFHPLRWVTTMPSKRPLLGDLLDGLAWLFRTNDSGTQSSALVSLPRRRPGVPSWTWCAWECGSTLFLPSWKLSWFESTRWDFLNTTSVSVEDVQGNIVGLSGNVIDGMAQLSTLSDIKFLRVRGWVCNISIPDISQDRTQQNMSYGHTATSYLEFEGDLPRLNALARKRRMQSVDGSFIFSGWVVYVMNIPDSTGLQNGRVMLLSDDPDTSSQDVERIDMCVVQFETLLDLFPYQTFLPNQGWTVGNFRIS